MSSILDLLISLSIKLADRFLALEDVLSMIELALLDLWKIMHEILHIFHPMP
jgi:hypothetical protein